MVCDRCRWVVRNELEKAGFHPLAVNLGEVEMEGDLNASGKEVIRGLLSPFGFELIDDRKSRQVEKIKTLITTLVQEQDAFLQTTLSEYLSRNIGSDYSHLSNLFSSVEGITIEQFFISRKTERVKELIVYDELSLSEIADQLHYSSVAHLSSQFKKVTGLTPTHFRNLSGNKRKPLDEA